MELKTLGQNVRVLTLKDGTEILFSYGTPVAAYVPYTKVAAVELRDKPRWVKTEKFYSRTTSRHIGDWMRAQGVDDARTVPQSEIDALVKGA